MCRLRPPWLYCIIARNRTHLLALLLHTIEKARMFIHALPGEEALPRPPGVSSIVYCKKTRFACAMRLDALPYPGHRQTGVGLYQPVQEIGRISSF